MSVTSDDISYMGDGVYIQFDGYGYILRANHHSEDSCTDQIYIEPDVLKNIIIKMSLFFIFAFIHRQ